MSGGADTVLIVDDDPDQAFICQEILVGENYRTAIVNCAEDALERLESNGISLLLIDLRLPDSDGISLAERIMTELRVNLPIIIYSSGPVNSGMLKRIKRMGMAFIPKGPPTDSVDSAGYRDRLTELVAEMIERHRFKIQLSDLKYEQQVQGGKISDSHETLQTILQRIEALDNKIYSEDKLLVVVQNGLGNHIRGEIEREVEDRVASRTANLPVIARDSVFSSWWFRSLLMFVLGAVPLLVTLKMQLGSIEKKLDQQGLHGSPSPHP